MLTIFRTGSPGLSHSPTCGVSSTIVPAIGEINCRRRIASSAASTSTSLAAVVRPSILRSS